MKRIAVFILTVTMILVFTACNAAGNGGNTGTGGAPSGEGTGNETPTPTTYKTGLGIIAEMSMNEVDADEDGEAKASVTSCAATFDTDGRIISVSFDTLECKAAITANGTITLPEDFASKKELGDDYGMKKASGIGKEWYEQVAALEYYCTGKTVAEVTGIAVKTEDHPGAPDVPELMSSCTISCTDFFSALTAAEQNAK